MKKIIQTVCLLSFFHCNAQQLNTPFQLWGQISTIGNQVFNNPQLKSQFTGGVGLSINAHCSKKILISYVSLINDRSVTEILPASIYGENKIIKNYSKNYLVGYQIYFKDKIRIYPQIGFFTSKNFYTGSIILDSNGKWDLFNKFQKFNFLQNGVVLNIKSMYSGSKAGITFDIYTHLAKQPMLGIGAGFHLGYLGKKIKSRKYKRDGSFL
jgi:hypothetical protein